MGGFYNFWLFSLKASAEKLLPRLSQLCYINQHLYETEQEAKRQIDLTLSRLVKERGITEELKATAPLRWAQEMNNAKHDAEEIVLRLKNRALYGHSVFG